MVVRVPSDAFIEDVPSVGIEKRRMPQMLHREVAFRAFPDPASHIVEIVGHPLPSTPSPLPPADTRSSGMRTTPLAPRPRAPEKMGRGIFYTEACARRIWTISLAAHPAPAQGPRSGLRYLQFPPKAGQGQDRSQSKPPRLYRWPRSEPAPLPISPFPALPSSTWRIFTPDGPRSVPNPRRLGGGVSTPRSACARGRSASSAADPAD